MPRRKLLVRRVMVAVGLLAGALGLSLFLLTCPPGEAFLCKVMEILISSALDLPVAVGELETNLVSRLQLRNVVIRPESAAETGPLLTLHHARIDYKPLALFRRQFILKNVELTGLAVTLRRDSLGTFNLPPRLHREQQPGGVTGRGIKVQVERLDVANSTMCLEDVRTSARLVAKNLDAHLSMLAENHYLCAIEVDSVGVPYREGSLLVGDLKLEGEWSPERVVLSQLTLHLPGMTLAGKAEAVSLGEEAKLSGKFELGGEVGPLAPVVARAAGSKLAGQLRCTLDLGGTLRRPELQGYMEIHRASMGNLKDIDLRLNATWQEGTLTLQQMQVALLGGHVDCSGTVTRHPALRHQFVLQAEELDLGLLARWLYGEGAELSGKLGAHLQWRGVGTALDSVRARGTLLATHLLFGPEPMPDLSLQLRLDRGIGQFLLKQGDAEIAAEATLRGSRLQGAFSGSLTDVGLLARLANVREFAGELALGGTLGGTTKSPKLHATVAGRHLTFRNLPIDTLGAEIAVAEHRVDVLDLLIRGALCPIDPDRPPLHLSGLTGSLFFEASARGPLTSPRGNLVIRLRDPAFGGYRFDRAEIGISAEEGHLRCNRLHLRKDSLLVDGRATYQLTERKGEARITFCIVPPQPAQQSSEPEIIPESMQSLTEGRSVGTIDVNFSAPSSKQWSASVCGRGLNIGDLLILAPKAPGVGGLLDLKLSAAQNHDVPTGKLWFLVREPKYAGSRLDSLRGEVVLAGNRLTVRTVQLVLGGQSTSATATIEPIHPALRGRWWTAASTISAHLQGEGFDVALLNPLLPTRMSLSGQATCDLHCEGSLRNPRFHGSLRLTEGSITREPDSVLATAIDLLAVLRDSTLLVEQMKGLVFDAPFHFHGRVTGSGWNACDFDLRGTIADSGQIGAEGILRHDSLRARVKAERLDLSLLRPLLGAAEGLRGACSADLAAHGPLYAPEVDGTVTVSGISLRLPRLQGEVDQGLVRLEFQQDAVHLDTLFARVAGGTLSGSGFLRYAAGKVKEANVQVRLDNLRIARANVGDVTVSAARLRYTKENDYYLLDGDVVLGESRLRYRFRPQSLVALARSTPRPRPEMPALLRQTRLNVRLRESEKLWIDNNLARLRLHSELSLQGNPTQPNLAGRLQAREGYILYLDRKFEVKKGVLDFVDPVHNNPLVDLEAQALLKSHQTLENRDYTITLSIKGPLDQAVVDLSSDPPLDRADILALLTLGARRQQLTAKGPDSGLSDVLQQRVATLSSQRLSSYATSKVSTLFRLQEMTIEGNLFRFGREWGPQLVASKRVTSRMSITYRTTVGHLNDQSIRLDYRLSRHLSVQSQTDQGGRSAIELKYGLRFK
ncbi:MAG: translocation/assembly module TamB domain-containing protein [Calditrichaeota bacterium]|nr:translocation/assembly module TamB domain-containing protein [Calditrichota bacterium]